MVMSIRMMLGRGRSGHLDGLLASGGLTGHVDVGPVSEQGAQPRPVEGVIFSDDEPAADSYCVHGQR
jgi:hypothetical protein